MSSKGCFAWMCYALAACWLVLMTAVVADERDMDAAGAAGAWFICGLFPAAALAGVGYLVRRSEKRAGALAQDEGIRQQFLGMMRARGAVTVDEAARELGTTPDAMKRLVYELVGAGMFLGRIEPDTGRIVGGVAAVAAAQPSERKCPGCGADVTVKGQASPCEYCGTTVAR